MPSNVPCIGKPTHCFWNVLEGKEKQQGGGRFESKGQEEIEKLFEWSVTQILSVPSEVAGIIWDYIESLFTRVLHVMVLDPTCLDLLVKDKETREPFLFCFPWRGQITSYYLAWEGCVFIYAVDPGFVGPELLQFWRPSPRKRIQNYEYNIKYECEYFFRIRKEIKLLKTQFQILFSEIFRQFSRNASWLQTTSSPQLPDYSSQRLPPLMGSPASEGSWNLSFINFTINLISFLLSL